MAIALKRELSDRLGYGSYFACGAEEGDDRSHFYRHEIVQTAKKRNYTANPRIYRSWARLVSRNTNQGELLIAFHGIGRQLNGLLACSAFWCERTETDDGEREVSPVTPLTDGVFLITSKEPLERTADRFSDWLEGALARGLKLWQETAP